MIKSEEIKLPSNKKFGFVFSCIFFLSAIYFLYEEIRIISYFLFVFSILFLFLSIFKANILYRLNILWMTLGLIVGKIVSPLIMGFIFFGIFTPLSLFFKIFKRDELELKIISRKSFWKKPKLNINNHDFFKNQF
jgi:hypothetical protein